MGKKHGKGKKEKERGGERRANRRRNGRQTDKKYGKWDKSNDKKKMNTRGERDGNSKMKIEIFK